MNEEELLFLAIEAAFSAGKEIMHIYFLDDHAVTTKEDYSPLTQADLASHHCIVNMLTKSELPVLSEEAAEIPYDVRKNWQRLWIVDPLDGTKEFINRNGEFTVNIALVEDGQPILGVIYVPVLRTMYFASENTGAFKTSDVADNSNATEIIKHAQKLPIIHTREVYTLVGSRSHMSKETEEFINEMRAQKGEIAFISKGSSLKLCMLAEGLADCYPRFAPTMEWDIAAGHAICKYAGLGVLDVETKSEMCYNRENLRNNWFIAGN